MTIKIPGDIGGRAVSGRGISRRVLGRATVVREAPARRSINAHLLGLDDAALATFGYDKLAVEEAGRGRFPV
ncbi:hypothetical protein [Bauldia sp.]|uniref:hypothetical protein n=1 Tax=Bauldia sp. TaxID=2575872 RepID=UPI003BAB91E6